jgi:hypothetical protein
MKATETEMPATDFDPTVKGPKPILAKPRVFTTSKGKGPAGVQDQAPFPPGSHTNVSVSAPQPYHIIRCPRWSKASRRWTNKFDHNHLRISRILRCLRILGLQRECTAFFRALERVYNDENDPSINIGEPTMGYWRAAVTQPLSIAPDGSECAWLKRWEAEQRKEREL